MFQVGILIFSAVLIAIVSAHIRIPYAVGLLCGGFVLSLLSIDLGIVLSPGLILTAILPALIFDAAISLNWRVTRRSLFGIVTIACAGVLLAMTACAVGMHYMLGWPWRSALLFGALIAATDPVAVLAVFKEHPVPERLKAMVQGESLLNDGIAATLFLLAASWAQGGEIDVLTVSISLGKSIGGGIACGAAVAFAATILAGKTGDELVEIAITILAAYCSYMLAHGLGMSGILASLTAGLVLCQLQSRSAFSQAGRSSVGPFWSFAAFAANSIVFILIGAREARTAIWGDLGAAIPGIRPPSDRKGADSISFRLPRPASW